MYNVCPLCWLPGAWFPPMWIHIFPSWIALHPSDHPCLALLQTTSDISGVTETITALGGHDYAISHLQVFGLYQYLYNFLWGGRGHYGCVDTDKGKTDISFTFWVAQTFVTQKAARRKVRFITTLGSDRSKFSWYILGFSTTFSKQRLFCLEMVCTLPCSDEISAFPNLWIMSIAPLSIILNPRCCRSWSPAHNTPEPWLPCYCCERQIGTFLREILHRINCMCHLSLWRFVGAARMTPEGWSCPLASHSSPLCHLRWGEATSEPLEIWAPQDLSSSRFEPNFAMFFFQLLISSC